MSQPDMLNLLARLVGVNGQSSFFFIRVGIKKVCRIICA